MRPVKANRCTSNAPPLWTSFRHGCLRGEALTRLEDVLTPSTALSRSKVHEIDCLFVFLRLSIFGCLSLSPCLSASLPLCLSVCLSVSLAVAIITSDSHQLLNSTSCSLCAVSRSRASAIASSASLFPCEKRLSCQTSKSTGDPHQAWGGAHHQKGEKAAAFRYQARPDANIARTGHLWSKPDNLEQTRQATLLSSCSQTRD